MLRARSRPPAAARIALRVSHGYGAAPVVPGIAPPVLCRRIGGLLHVQCSSIALLVRCRRIGVSLNSFVILHLPCVETRRLFCPVLSLPLAFSPSGGPRPASFVLLVRLYLGLSSLRMYREALYAPAPGPSQTNGGVYVVCFVALYMVISIIAPRITHTHNPNHTEN